MNLQVDRLTRRYGRVHALAGVSFSTGSGEIVGLIGPNGAGKSTLLSCIAGLDAPDEGRVLVDGAELTAPNRREALFYMPDGIVPWRDQRASWVLDFAAEFHGAAERWRTELGKALDLAAFVGRRVGELSKGERKRVLLAFALLVPRPVTLIDEPFDGLDPRQARALGELARSRAASGRTLVLSIHAMGQAARTCDRHILLHEGRVVGDGTLEALRARLGLPGTAGLEEVFLAVT